VSNCRQPGNADGNVSGTEMHRDPAFLVRDSAAMRRLKASRPIRWLGFEPMREPIPRASIRRGLAGKALG
jgi:hypothetical protein